MIRQLSGTVSHSGAYSVILNVQGVGYFVRTTVPGTEFPVGTELLLNTYLAVRENALDLYGFRTLDELEVFELLIELPKVGPKSAQQILTQADIELLKQAVAQDDATYLSKLSGIGKKSAEKIVAGLKEKLEIVSRTMSTGAHITTDQMSDTIDALVALGYAQGDARRVVSELPPEVANTTEAVREALKRL